jgi:hypothetical protein
MENQILEVLNAHVQSSRSGKCECGWRATYPDPRYPIGAEHFQHREHLAEEIAKVCDGSDND